MIEAVYEKGVCAAITLGRLIICIDAYNATGDFRGRALVFRFRGYGITLGLAHK